MRFINKMLIAGKRKRRKEKCSHFNEMAGPNSIIQDPFNQQATKDSKNTV